MAVGRPPVNDSLQAGTRISNTWAKWISNFASAYDKFIVDHPATAATTTTLGHVKQSAAVADGTATVTSANASTVVGTSTTGGEGFANIAEFNAAITAINTHTTLANELKTDVNAIQAQLNDLLAKLRTAGQLDT